MRATNKWLNMLLTLLTYLLVLALIFPVLWMIVTGFKQERDAYAAIPSLIFQPTLDQFSLAFNSGFGAYLFNSVVAALVSTALAMLLGIPAAYSMVFQMRPKSSNDLLFFALSTRFMPFAAILIPLFVIVSRLNLLDNLFTLIIVYTAMNLPLIIWMARSYFLELPKDVLESARLDGANTLRMLAGIVVPMAAPGLVASALLAVIFAWNDFFFAITLTYTQSPTLPVMVAVFSSNQDEFLAKVSALATCIIIVPVILGIYAQRHLVRGLTGGAIK
ncbi:carbohydrate ABC transporter permease [Ktedonosporobacter rubrisoli]|uniref:Carbohydrate ABC transporter permease n=1 Tax=Ktedonosporobacter rubrisoli TaxID=2509675 RepID=A0A4P6K532_KTERU|nr:carbohydrate ABC transporter permease [Ktedonosporobacter rubrisoli]QBD82950.1 carbohydrate ABC transporter permease [Ktedonosporobacter rubrisoli]